MYFLLLDFFERSLWVIYDDNPKKRYQLFKNIKWELDLERLSKTLGEKEYFFDHLTIVDFLFTIVRGMLKKLSNSLNEEDLVK